MQKLMPANTASLYDGVVREARFSTADVLRMTHASTRQVNYWCELGVIRPVVAGRSGVAREFDAVEVRVVEVVATLAALGAPLSTCSRVAGQLRRSPLNAPGWRSLVFIDQDGWLHDGPLGSGWLLDLAALFSEPSSV